MRRIESVDGLRGLAALGVAWFHLYTQNGGPSVSEAMPAALNVASVSGALWGSTILRDFRLRYFLYALQRPQHQWTKMVAIYFLKRSVRLDPAYWVALAAYGVGIPILLGISADLSGLFAMRDGSPAAIAKNIFYFLPIDAPLYIPIAWTFVFRSAVLHLLRLAGARTELV